MVWAAVVRRPALAPTTKSDTAAVRKSFWRIFLAAEKWSDMHLTHIAYNPQNGLANMHLTHIAFNPQIKMHLTHIFRGLKIFIFCLIQI